MKEDGGCTCTFDILSQQCQVFGPRRPAPSYRAPRSVNRQPYCRGEPMARQRGIVRSDRRDVRSRATAGGRRSWLGSSLSVAGKRGTCPASSLDIRISHLSHIATKSRASRRPTEFPSRVLARPMVSIPRVAVGSNPRRKGRKATPRKPEDRPLVHPTTTYFNGAQLVPSSYFTSLPFL